MDKKKLFLLMLGGATVILASCSSDNDDVTAAGTGGTDTSVVTFAVSTSQGTQSRSYSDGTTATLLKYAVYNSDDEDGAILIALSDAVGTLRFDGSSLTATVPITLANGNAYSVIFWAQSQSCPYTVDFDDKTVSYAEGASLTCNSESYDAFYGVWTTEKVNGNSTESVTLYRPFAQLNFGTDDLDKYQDATSSDVKYTKVTVSGVYSSMSLWDGSVDSGDMTTLTFDFSLIPDGETFPTSSDYDYLAMNYLLTGDEKATVDVELFYSNTDEDEANHSLTISSVPIQRNYRTNIYGSLLTSTLSYEVEIEPSYSGEEELGYVTVSSAEELTAALESDSESSIVLTDDITLSENIEVTSDKTLDLNGSTLLQTSTSKRNITVDSDATLTVTDSGSDGTVSSEGATGSYGLFDVYGTLIIEGGTFIDDGAGDGAMIKGRSGGTIIIENGDFTVTNDDSNSSSLVGNFVVSASECAVSITGGTYNVGENCWGGIKLDSCYGTDSDEVEISGITITTVNTEGIELMATDAVISDATISVEDENSYYSTAIAINNQSKVTVNSGTYRAPYAVFVYSSGGYAYLNGGTYNGSIAVLKADNDTYVNGYSDGREEGSYIYVYGGYYTGAYSIATGGSYTTLLEISGGYFTVDPSDYVASGYSSSTSTVDDYDYSVSASQ